MTAGEVPDIGMSSCGEEGSRPQTSCENSALPDLSAALLHGLQEIAVGLGGVWRFETIFSPEISKAQSSRFFTSDPCIQ